MTRVAGMEGPKLPLEEAWSVGLGQILGDQLGIPGVLRGAALKFDSFGRLEISPGSISFDGVEVHWEEIEEIKVGNASGLLLSRAVEREFDRLMARLPPVPARRWLVEQAVELLVALGQAAVGLRRDAGDGPRSDGTKAPAGVPLEVTYRRRRTRKNLTPGVFVTLVAALVPDTSDTVAALARAHGVKITTVTSTRYDKHAVAVVNLAADAYARLRPVPRAARYGGSAPVPADEAELASRPSADEPPPEQTDEPTAERGLDDPQAAS
ncbi:hypothetical protein AB0J94_32015 [Micromonospora noduli]|uniref:hypothetical protein n=1 Tax=Micromonospora noduli TaxID=709876 RepID=UPI003425295D